MSKTTNIKTNDAEMRTLSDAELDTVVGGRMALNIPGDTTQPTAPGALAQHNGGGTTPPGAWILAGMFVLGGYAA
jgi:hypothetical protein